MLVECGTWAEYEIAGTGLAELGLYFRELRSRKGLSIRGLARESGVSQAYLSMLESGSETGPPSLKILNRLGDYFQVQIDTFLLVGGMKAMPPRMAPRPLPAVMLDVLATLDPNPHRVRGWASPATLFTLAECIVAVADGVDQPEIQAAVDCLRPFTKEKANVS